MAALLGVSGHSPALSDKHQLSACFGFEDGVLTVLHRLASNSWTQEILLAGMTGMSAHSQLLLSLYLPLDAGLYLAVP